MTDIASPEVESNQLLPAEAYFAQDWFDREQEQLFGRTWRYAGMTGDYARPGSYRSVQAGRHPLVVVRGHDGVLRAFHNVCRHRGAAVLPGDGRVRRNIVCPYHNWTYGLDGCLLAVTQRREVEPHDRSTLGLHPAALEVWRGLVFVHPDPDAEPLLEWLGDLPDRIAPYDAEELVDVPARETRTMRANWKVFVENALDNYHLGYVHRENLSDWDHKRQEQHACGRRHWFFYEPPLVPGLLPQREVEAGLRIISPDTRWYGSSYGMIFPNLFLLSGPGYWAFAEVTPLGAEETRVELRVRVLPGQTGRIVVRAVRDMVGQMAGRARKVAAELAASARDGGLDAESVRTALQAGRRYTVAEEDVFCCESVQRGIRSPRFAVGPIARRYERGIQAFQRNVLDYVPLDGGAAR